MKIRRECPMVCAALAGVVLLALPLHLRAEGEAAAEPHEHKFHRDYEHKSQQISAEQLLAEMKKSPAPLVVNIFEQEAFKRRHIDGSINVALSILEPIAKTWDQNARVILYCVDARCPGNKAAAHILIDRLGFKDVVIYDGGLDEWEKKGYPTVVAKQVEQEKIVPMPSKLTGELSTEELLQEMKENKDIILMNVLDADVYQDCKIMFPGGGGNEINIPLIDLMAEFDKATKSLDKRARIIAYCTSNDCPSSAMAVSMLREGGFINIAHYKDGMLGWYRKNSAEYPREGACQLGYLKVGGQLAPAAAQHTSWWEWLLSWIKFW